MKRQKSKKSSAVRWELNPKPFPNRLDSASRTVVDKATLFEIQELFGEAHRMTLSKTILGH